MVSDSAHSDATALLGFRDDFLGLVYTYWGIDERVVDLAGVVKIL